MHGFDLPIIGVARSGDLDTLRERARRSVEANGGTDPKSLRRLLERLRYVKGSHNDLETFHALRRELGDAEHPLHYLESRRHSSARSLPTSKPQAARRRRG